MRSTIRFGIRHRLLMLSACLALGAVVCVLARDSTSPAEARAGGPNRAPSAESTVRARVTLEALGTQRDGITGRPRVQTSDVLGAGDTITRHLRGGDDHGREVCNAKFIDPSEGAERGLLWRFDATLTQVAHDRTTITVHWTRSAGGRTADQERDQTRTFALGPTDLHVLDYVEDAGGSASPCASLLIRISAQPIVDRDQRPISVDVWTVDEDSAGEAVSVHQHVQGVTGQPIAFKFPPFGVAAGNEAGSNVAVGIEGAVQVVEAPDGLLDVNLEARRRTSWAGAETRGEGRVQFRAARGETAALLLPQPTGTLGRAGAPPAVGAAKLDLARVFAGHRLSLYVKVEPLQ